MNDFERLKELCMQADKLLHHAGYFTGRNPWHDRKTGEWKVEFDLLMMSLEYDEEPIRRDDDEEQMVESDLTFVVDCFGGSRDPGDYTQWVLLASDRWGRRALIS